MIPTVDQLEKQLAEVKGERDEALTTVKSVAVMLGWGNVPPRELLEMNLRSNRIRLEHAERDLAVAKEALAKVESARAAATKAMLDATCGPVERAEWEALVIAARNAGIAARTELAVERTRTAALEGALEKVDLAIKKLEARGAAARKNCKCDWCTALREVGAGAALVRAALLPAKQADGEAAPKAAAVSAAAPREEE